MRLALALLPLLLLAATVLPGQAMNAPFPETVGGASVTTETLARLKVSVRDIAVGKGDSPAAGKVLVMHLKAWGADGKVLDASLKMRTPLRYFYASGWMPKYIDDALASMRVGGRREITFSEPAPYSIGVHPFDSKGSTGRLAQRLEIALIRVEDPPDYQTPRFH